MKIQNANFETLDEALQFVSENLTANFPKRKALQIEGIVVSGMACALKMLDNAHAKGQDHFVETLSKLDEDIQAYPDQLAKKLLQMIVEDIADRVAAEEEGVSDGSIH